jgi:2',3'-cyclic-nucleotide 2'-phosphodiesterase (5'-nucleotidase family)
MRTVNGVPVAIIGQAFPYTPIANPRYFVPDWTFGIREDDLQKTVDDVRAKGAWVVVLLSHNGMDVDLKLASRVAGIDAILGGHTHDGVPKPTIVANRGGKTLVTNAGSNGKFLAVLDLDVREPRSPTIATACCRRSARAACGSGHGHADSQGAGAVRGEAVGEARGAEACSIAAAISTGRPTS